MYDALLLVSFGGPEAPEQVIPFLENVLRGRNVPRERMLEVAEHYYHFGGKSPIQQQCRDLKEAIEADFKEHGIDLPVYWGNRNWNPYLTEALDQMRADGKKHALAFFTSAYSCYSGCRQYRENIEEARQKLGESAPKVDKLRMPYNHPGFVEPQVEYLKQALAQVPESRRANAPLLFTAHSIPMAMSDNSNYVRQLTETARLIAEGAGHGRWELAYQSRSGPPQQPWLEPDVGDRIRELHSEHPLQDVLVQPIGFVSDHMEVLYDLDEEVAGICQELGIQLHRIRTVGTDRRFVRMIGELVVERMTPGSDKPSLGSFGPSHDVCPVNCCLYPRPTSGPAGRPTAT